MYDHQSGGAGGIAQIPGGLQVYNIIFFRLNNTLLSAAQVASFFDHLIRKGLRSRTTKRNFHENSNNIHVVISMTLLHTTLCEKGVGNRKDSIAALQVIYQIADGTQGQGTWEANAKSLHHVFICDKLCKVTTS